jgi:dTDP-L-rhamnose 4-epimerase
MSKKILITGGAGFIGSHLADLLLENGYRVRILDNLSEQVHGIQRSKPSYLNSEAEFMEGDVRDPERVRQALKGVEAVYHFAAKVGVGQSMYEVAGYTSVNNAGTAVLLEALIEAPVERLIVASSMSLYGEGMYRAPDGTVNPGIERRLEQLKRKDWELRDENGDELRPVATPETKPPSLASVYALSKFDQERMCLLIGKAYGIATVALRFFNVFGTRQALSNPYTGVLAIFASRLLNDNRPMIFEDGQQRRDFVSVHDVVRGCRLALEVPEACGHVFNVGSGQCYKIGEVARRLGWVMGKETIEPELSGKYRMGDIRHCFADISQARKVLGYAPRVDFEEGLCELVNWLDGQVAADHAAEASAELTSRGLAV